jgi:phosphoribosylanthranilate isomerase
MALKTNVYISDVTNLTEARYYAGMEVTIIGFNATPGAESYMEAHQFDAITSWISGPQTAWQWHLPLSQNLVNLVQESPTDFIETTHIPTPETLKFAIKPILLRTHKLSDVTDWPPDVAAQIKGIIWEGDINEIDRIKTAPVYFQLKSTENTESLVNNTRQTGIALKGIPELRPGWNDFDQLANLLESLETS